MPEQQDKFGRYALVLLVVGALVRLLLMILLRPFSSFTSYRRLVYPGGPGHSPALISMPWVIAFPFTRCWLPCAASILGRYGLSNRSSELRRV